MAGTTILTEVTHTSVKCIAFDWLSSAAGAADQATANVYDGVLERVEFIPDGGGTQPTDQYDVTLTDANSVDVLAGLGANLSNAAAVTKTHANGLTAVAGSKLTLNVTNAGNAKGGVVIVYLR